MIFPLFGDASALRTYPDDQYQWLLRQQINEVGNHPAVLMFAFGACSMHARAHTRTNTHIHLPSAFGS